jgi:hypothetical protein
MEFLFRGKDLKRRGDVWMWRNSHKCELVRGVNEVDLSPTAERRVSSNLTVRIKCFLIFFKNL